MTYIAARTVLVQCDCPGTDRDGSGSGVVLLSSAAGSQVATAAHVAEEGCALSVRRGEGEFMPAAITARNGDRDLAVLWVEGNYQVGSPLETYPYLGQAVITAGYPMQLLHPGSEELSITTGVIATKNLAGEKGTYFRITAPIYFGNSGGGVWTREGTLIGISTSMAALHLPGIYPLPYPGYFYLKPSAELTELLKEPQ